jgi:hypothetical protein
MCLYQKLIKNRKNVANKKNGGNVPVPSDKRVLMVPVGCGNCIECRKQKSRGWRVRLLEDIKKNKNGRFVTLTFSNASIKELSKDIPLKGYDLDNEIVTRATRWFLERWRKKYKKSLRHWFVSELGGNGTENVHLHGIVWTDKDLNEVERIWKYGFVWKGKEVNGKIVNYVNEKTVNYIVKYVTKIDFKHQFYKSKILTSAGIGAGYDKSAASVMNKYKGDKTQEYYRTSDGSKIAMPVYWRNKIYSDKERELLWLNMLDKNVRYVCGIKIDVSKDMDKYYKVVDMCRDKNKKLGYGSDEINWEKFEYEKSRRLLKQEERIRKAYR